MQVRPFDAIVSDHGPTVARVCRALLGPEDADDAWSETFLAALRAYPGLRPGSNVEGWLVTIAHRKAIDILRRRSRRPDPPGIDPAGPDGPAGPDDLADGVVDGMADGVVSETLLAALRALPPKQRGAVVHHYLAGLPYREVAEVLGTSPEAARRSGADGIAALRAALARPHDRKEHDHA